MMSGISFSDISYQRIGGWYSVRLTRYLYIYLNIIIIILNMIIIILNIIIIIFIILFNTKTTGPY